MGDSINGPASPLDSRRIAQIPDDRANGPVGIRTKIETRHVEPIQTKMFGHLAAKETAAAGHKYAHVDRLGHLRAGELGPRCECLFVERDHGALVLHCGTDCRQEGLGREEVRGSL